MSEPSVSVVLVALNEPPARVERAIAAVTAQDYAGSVEILVATPDATAVPAGARWVDNPTGARSAGLNLATLAANGDVICRVDARSVLPPDYIRRCVQRLDDGRVGVVGGHQHPIAADNSRRARRIVRALRNPWLLGGAAYRRPGASGPVDTAYLGVFRRTELLALGGYDESLDANEDFDLCQRYRAAGFTVWLEDLDVDYEARDSLRALWQQYVAFGRSKVRYWRRTGERPRPRQLLAIGAAPVVPLVFLYNVASGVILSGWLYGLAAEALRRSPASARARRAPARLFAGRH